MATTVVALLLAQSRSIAAMTELHRQEQAAALAEEWFAGWRIRPESAIFDHGEFQHCPGWRWERREIKSELTRSLHAIEVTLRIYSAEIDGAERLMATYQWLERADGRSGGNESIDARM